MLPSQSFEGLIKTLEAPKIITTGYMEETRSDVFKPSEDFEDLIMISKGIRQFPL